MDDKDQIIQLGKVLAEEQRRGCDDGAAEGGLERFLVAWRLASARACVWSQRTFEDGYWPGPAQRLAPRRTCNLAEKLGTKESNTALFAAYRERARKTRNNLLAPAAAVDAIEAAIDLSFEEGCRKEREVFKRLLVSSQGPGAAILQGMSRHRPLAIAAICSSLSKPF